MNQIEQIKAEIERRRKEFIDRGKQTRHDAEVIRGVVISECSNLLAFIYSLPEEPSDNIGQLNELPTSAKHSEDLEKAAYNYTNNTASRSIGKAWLQRDVRLAFIRGAEWQKEQMMKEAVIAETNIIYDTQKDAYRYQLTLPENTENPYRDCRDWKITIIKEDEK